MLHYSFSSYYFLFFKLKIIHLQAVGVELEFCLMRNTEECADQSVFANTTSLNEQEEFLSDLYEQLQQQYIPVETIHAESGPGQLEVVLQYSKDPVQLADDVLLAQETVRAVAKKYAHKALFLPKYDMTKAGNGMHVHISLYDAETGHPSLSDGGAGLSAMGIRLCGRALAALARAHGIDHANRQLLSSGGKGMLDGQPSGMGIGRQGMRSPRLLGPFHTRVEPRRSQIVRCVGQYLPSTVRSSVRWTGRRCSGFGVAPTLGRNECF